MLNVPYQRVCIESTPNWPTTGLGGVVESLCYRVRNVPVSLGGHTIGIQGLVVETSQSSAAMDFSCNLGIKTLIQFDKIRFNLVNFVLTTYPRQVSAFVLPRYDVPSFRFAKPKGLSLLQAAGIIAVGIGRGLIDPNAPANPDL